MRAAVDPDLGAGEERAVIGSRHGDDRDAGAVSFRYRDGSQRNGVPIDEAVQLIVDHVTSRSNADPTAA